MHRLALSFLPIICIFVSARSAPPSAPKDRSPPSGEKRVTLDVLKDVVGEWTAIDKENDYFGAVLKISHQLNKRFITCNGQYFVPGHAFIEAKWILGCDHAKGHFRLWSFFNTGDAYEAKGNWNPETGTMTFTGITTEGMDHEIKIQLPNFDTLVVTYKISWQDSKHELRNSIKFRRKLHAPEPSAATTKPNKTLNLKPAQ